MARLTLRLPDSLHETLTELAEREGVSVNHLVVYALAKATAVEQAARQRAQFETMRARVPAERAEAALAQILAEREAE